jgi:hypothetical protein
MDQYMYMLTPGADPLCLTSAEDAPVCECNGMNALPALRATGSTVFGLLRIGFFIYTKSNSIQRLVVLIVID